MKKLYSLLLVPVALVATGCLQERELVDPTSNLNGGAPGAATNIALENGSLRGDFGPRQGFDGSATELTGASERELNTSTTSITRTENGRGTGMVILWTNGVLLENLEVGAHDFRYDPSALEPSAVSVNVCSGSGDASSIDYDAPAESGSVLVTRTPEGRVFDVHTETPAIDAMGNATGSIDTANATFTLVN